MTYRTTFFTFITFLLLSSCSNSVYKTLAELQTMPTPDYNYIVQPVFISNKEAVEFKIKELYSAEEVKIGAAGTHGYDRETKAQIKEKYWFQIILLNSQAI